MASENDELKAALITRMANGMMVRTIASTIMIVGELFKDHAAAILAVTSCAMKEAYLLQRAAGIPHQTITKLLEDLKETVDTDLSAASTQRPPAKA